MGEKDPSFTLRREVSNHCCVVANTDINCCKGESTIVFGNGGENK
jgi:hypothetical protein